MSWGQRSRLSLDELDELRDRVLEAARREPGVSGRELARRFNVSHATAARWLAGMGLTRDLWTEPRQKALELAADHDVSLAEVARRVGVSASTVRRWLQRAGQWPRGDVDTPEATEEGS